MCVYIYIYIYIGICIPARLRLPALRRELRRRAPDWGPAPSRGAVDIYIYIYIYL